MSQFWKRFGGHLARRERYLILAGSVLIGLLWTWAATWWGNGLDHRIYGVWNASHGSAPSDGAGVLLIPIDQADKQKYGFPLPRELYGRLLRRLLDAGVTTVALDLFFEGPGPTAAGDFDLEATFEETCLCLAYRLTRDGAQIARVLPHVPLIDGFSPLDLEPRMGFRIPGEHLEVRPVWLKLGAHGMKARQGLPYLGFDTPPPAAVSYALPVVALAHDLRITPGELVLPVRHYLTDDFIEGVHVEAGQAWLNPPVDRPLPSLGLSQCLETPPTELKRQLGSYTRSGRLIALVGDRDAGTRNSLAGHVSDLEIQGFTLLNLIHNNFLAPVGLTGALLVTVGAALWVGLWGAGVNLAGASLAAAFGAVGMVALNYWAVTRPGVMLPLVAPLLSQLSAYGVVMWLHLHSSSRHRRRVVAAARDCCPTDPLPIREEQSRVLTVLLWDLRSYVESDPGLLREYFACAKRVLEYFGGLVLDYADCTQVVVFGLGDGSHALPACQAAAGLVAEAQARPGLPPNRLSIATGELEIRAAEGRSVASGIAVRSARLANLAKLSDWEVRLTPATWMACDGQLPALVAGSVRVPLYVLRVEELVREWRREEAFPWHPKEGPAALTLGGHFNGYRLDRVIGQGGMGRVFQAEDTRLLRKVALKVVIGSLKAGQSKRFLQEARAVARVHHPSIIAIYEFGLEPFPYIVMEYVPGQDLSTLLEHKQSQPWAWVVDVVARVLDALTVVHGQGIIHRDLKPSNIMVTPEGQVKLMDFGLARFTEESTRLSRTGQICGTPRYMAPEHLESEFGKVDEVSDLFAVAATLYELLTGVTPVKGETMPTILYDLIYGQPEPPHVVNPSVPENVSRACLKGLQKQKADRYLTAQEFAAALRSCVDVR